MLRAGDRVGNYEVGGVLGVGGMASVYRAHHTTLGSEHAIKVLNADVAENPQVRERFVQEGRLLAQVRHPGLVRVTDVVNDQGIAGFVMDVLEGEDLAARLRAGPLSPEVAAGLMLQALSAVGHAHAAGVVHRDLKPANLFLVHRPGKLPLVKVLDFGIAKLRGLEMTRGMQALGTVAYMSPEQIEAPSSVDARSDLFSLGVVLFEMVAGEPPFSGDTDFAIMQRIVEGRSDPLPERAGVLAPVVRRALQTRPEDRFSDAGSFAEVLRGLAPIDIRQMVAEWENQGSSVDPTVGRPPAQALGSTESGHLSDSPPPPPSEPGALLPTPPQIPDPIHGPAPLAAAEQRTVVRWAGILQLVSGIINVVFMATFQALSVTWCPIFGLPAIFGLLLFGIGAVEILSGLSVLTTGRPNTLRRTAQLELVSFAGFGLISGFVGLYVLSLRQRYPEALVP